MVAVYFFSIFNGKKQSRILFLSFQQYKTPAIPYFSIFLKIRTTATTTLSIFFKLKPQLYLFYHFQQNKAPGVCHFSIFKRQKLQRYFIFAFLSVQDPNHFLVVPNLSIFTYIRPHPNFILKIFKQIKTPAVPYFSIFNRIKREQYLFITFSID